ncbi:MAG: methyl-accepting chemotaxis protein [Rickettsiales bacterium]|jgi:hypothetical protein|nr:methyl-accepting chemotaxis protein [Rickettsiales bacterium]
MRRLLCILALSLILLPFVSENGWCARNKIHGSTESIRITRSSRPSAKAAIRVPIARAATSNRAVVARAATGSSGTTAAAQWLETQKASAALNETCRKSYYECMDNFCNVLSDVQGRCSCSSNISKYKRSEDSLKSATEALSDIAVQMQNIGMSAEEIKALYTQTEAEAAMEKQTDNSQINSELQKIGGMTIEVKRTTSQSSASSGGVLDLSGLLDFSSDVGFGITDIIGTGGTVGSISNQRGAALYSTATARCKKHLGQECTPSNVINGYDIEIDKACIKYERELETRLEETKQRISKAQGMLQKGRLAVSQNKNQYDLRGCVSALDSCMQDEYACGEEYSRCLDPTGKHIVGNSLIPSSLNEAEMLSNIWKWASPPAAFNDSFISTNSNDGLIKHLLKIMGNPSSGDGICAAVLGKCEKLWKTDGSYNQHNSVVMGWLKMVLPKIAKSQQDVMRKFMESNPCSAGQKSIGTLCESTCASGKPYVGANNVCFDVCPTGQICTNGCPTSTPYINGTSCVATCASGKPYADANNVCFESCPAGQTCTNGCPTSTPYIYDTSCVANCPDDKQYINTRSLFRCVSQCDTDLPYIDENNACWSDRCPLGHTCHNQCTNDNEPYVVNEYYSECSERCIRNKPYADEARVCKTVCPAGQTCTNGCPADTPYINDTNCVAVCPSNKPYVNANRVCLPECPEGQTCTNGCPAAAPYRDGMACVRSCPSGRYDDINVCL